MLYTECFNIKKEDENMERVMSVEDKIRRAEEIYYKRRQQGIPAREIEKTRTIKKDIKLFRKMIKQIIICLIIYGIFYVIVNNNYIFSEDFTNKAKEILSTDINFAEVYSVVTENVKKIYNDFTTDTNSNDNKNIEGEDDIQNNEENIGGAEEILTAEIQGFETPIVEESKESNIESQISEAQETNQEQQELTQEEKDVNYIKSTINFIRPVEGTISSKFGLRNPTTSTVPKNHTGTDIAAKIGTKILAATDGTVILSSSKGDYGKHLKVQINDVTIVYAHCNKLYVNEGDTIKQGQEIAEVGETGNTTGPHLHFEIRYQDRYIDPQLILEL